MFSKGNVAVVRTHRNVTIIHTLKVDLFSFYNTFSFMYNRTINMIPEFLELLTVCSFSL